MFNSSEILLIPQVLADFGMNHLRDQTGLMGVLGVYEKDLKIET